MSNKAQVFVIDDSKAFKIKMLNWSRRFNIFCLLDNNGYEFENAAFDCILAAGCKKSISLKGNDNLASLQQFSEKNDEWLFGHFGYDIFDKSQQNPPHENDVDFGPGFFFIPEILLRLVADKLFIETDTGNAAQVFNDITGQGDFTPEPAPVNIDLQSVVTPAEYKNIIIALQEHIHRGDCYEINFCQHFFANNVSQDPFFMYNKLARISPNPFSAFYKLNDKYCLCASPERFLKKSGNRLLSQPIKGTIKRDVGNALADEQHKRELSSSSKNKTENVMIVDLVRNDLSKICLEGSVHVSELFGVYSFPQVHQMISTIEGEVSPGLPWTDIIKACFPMGSMTGAPKIKVMELIKRYEAAPRGLFSGSIGYISPNKDFDFNVVIRSLMYDVNKKLISFKAGGGITFNSNPAEEYEESLLKAEAILQTLRNS